MAVLYNNIVCGKQSIFLSLRRAFWIDTPLIKIEMYTVTFDALRIAVVMSSKLSTTTAMAISRRTATLSLKYPLGLRVG
jgi:hypothetical protein